MRLARGQDHALIFGEKHEYSTIVCEIYHYSNVAKSTPATVHIIAEPIHASQLHGLPYKLVLSLCWACE